MCVYIRNTSTTHSIGSIIPSNQAKDWLRFYPINILACDRMWASIGALELTPTPLAVVHTNTHQPQTHKYIVQTQPRLERLLSSHPIDPHLNVCSVYAV